MFWLLPRKATQGRPNRARRPGAARPPRRAGRPGLNSGDAPGARLSAVLRGLRRSAGVAPGSAPGLENHGSPLFQFRGRSFSSRPLSRTPRECPCPAWHFLGGPSASAPLRGSGPTALRRPGRDVSNPPLSPPGAARQALPFPAPFQGRREGVAHVRDDPCGKARRRNGPPSAASAVPEVGPSVVRRRTRVPRSTRPTPP